jgi:hypothetical protein
MDTFADVADQIGSRVADENKGGCPFPALRDVAAWPEGVSRAALGS